MSARILLVVGAALGLSLLTGCPRPAQAGTEKVASSAAASTAKPAPGPAGSPIGKSKVALDRARGLAQRVLIVDTHVDLPYRLFDPKNPKAAPKEDVSQRTDKGDFDAERARKGGLDAPFMSIYVPADKETYERPGAPTFQGAKATADALIDLVEGLAQKHPDDFVVAKSVADVRAAFAAKKIAFPLGMENGSPIENDLKNLAHFHQRGIRYITLAHSKDNHISDSSYDDRHVNGGLSPFGKQVVAEMNRLGILVDISHLSDAAAEQALAESKAPVIASHSSCRHFTPGFERNMSDALIKKVAAQGGVVQVNFGSTFIDGDLQKFAASRWEAWDKYKKDHAVKDDEAGKADKAKFYRSRPLGVATVEQVADHIQHIRDLVGIEHVGFGSDFDGVGDSLPYGLKDVAAYPNLIRVLLERGFSDDDIQKIAGENVLRVWAAAEAYAAQAQKGT